MLKLQPLMRERVNHVLWSEHPVRVELDPWLPARNGKNQPPCWCYDSRQFPHGLPASIGV